MQKTYSYYLLLFFVIIIWGLSWPVSKIALVFISPIWMAALRLVIGFFSMVLLLGWLKKLKLPFWKDVPIILVIGLLQIGAFMALINLGLAYVDAGRSAVLVYTTPIWIMPIAIFLLKEPNSYLKWIGFALGMLGVLVLFNPYLFNWHDQNAVLGNSILLLAALCWAISILCARNMQWNHSPLELISWQLIIGTIPVLAIAFYKEPSPIIVWNATLIASLLFTGVLGTAFAYWGSLVLSKELPSVTLSIAFLAVPVCGLLFSYWMLHEEITPSMIVAMICIISGLITIAIDVRKETP